MELNSGERQVAPKQTRYFTGKPCKAGHVAERYTANNTCVECNKAKLAVWREENAERESQKAVERVRRWRADNPDRAVAWECAHRLTHAGEIAQKKAAYYQANKLTISRRARGYRERNRDAIDQRVAMWRCQNPDAMRAIKRNYRARLNHAPGTHSADDVIRMMAEQGGSCFYCGSDLGEKYHVDHMHPLVRGGSNDPGNLCLACPTCNVSKGAKTSDEFRQYREATC